MDAIDRIKSLCKELKINQQSLADSVGVKEDTVSNWFRRKSASFSKYLPQIADALDTTVEYLLTGKEPSIPDKATIRIAGRHQISADALDIAFAYDDASPELQAVFQKVVSNSNIDLPKGAEPIDPQTFHRIPILGRISAGLPLYAEQHIEGYTLTDLNGGAEYFALRVSGDSMNAARMQDGDLLIVRRQETVENGEVAVVMVGDEDATVKRFYATGSTVTLMPQSTNPEHQPQIYDTEKTRIRIIGRVVKVEFTL